MLLGQSGGEAGLREECLKTLKESLKLKGDYQTQVYSSQMVLVVIRQEGWTV
jgi:hypothetical protein